MTSKSLRLLSALSVLAIALTTSARAQFGSDPFGIGGGSSNVDVSLIAESDSVVPGETFTVALKLVHADGFNTYWINPGVGTPTDVKWDLPEGFTASPIIWPIPKQKDDVLGISNIYQDTAHLLVDITAPNDLTIGDPVKIGGQASWLQCDKNGCVPGKGDVSLKLKVAQAATPAPDVKAVFDEVRSAQGSASDAWDIATAEEGGAFLIKLTPKDGANASPGKISVFEASAKLESAAPEQSAEGETIVLKMKPGGDDAVGDITGFLTAENGWETGGAVKALSLSPVATTAAVAAVAGGGEAAEPVAEEGDEDLAIPATTQAAIDEMRSWGVVNLDEAAKKKGTFGIMILFAFLGGIILNVMPCVFPVLGLKIMGFVQQAGDDKAKIKKHGLVFAAGVISSLWFLSITLMIVRAVGGDKVAWGFQLQNPFFLIFMIGIMFIFGLNLSGLFELGTSLTSAGSNLQSKKGYAGSFFSGVLAVLVASPCTGPFMGPAIAFALSAPVIIGFLVFTALAVGLATPYVLLSFFPALIQKLPKPRTVDRKRSSSPWPSPSTPPPFG